MKKLLYILTFLPWIASANPIDDKCSQHIVFGAPIVNKPDQTGQYICRIGYAVRYDYGNKVSDYAVEKITRASIVGKATRKDDFREDQSVPSQHRSTLMDYQASGYDRGHMAPAADFYYSAEAMSESFYLTNMMPQVPGNNRGIWKHIETHVRTWVESTGDVYVVTGTIHNKGGKSIGNGVKIPSHVYKVIYNPVTNKSISFMLPNEKLAVDQLEKYTVSISDVEAAAGVSLFPTMPPDKLGVKTKKATLSEWVK